MKYQSEIVNEILEQRGHEKSSLHYESECIQTWIDENKGSYPKLCDYQSEWLNYINENPIGVFPYETLTDVTEATVNNVVPYSYKSAILSGSTKYRDIDTGEFLETFEEGRNLELVSVKMPVLTTTGKNLLNPNSFAIGSLLGIDGSFSAEYTTRITSDFISIYATDYTLDNSENGFIKFLFEYDANKQFIKYSPSPTGSIKLNSSSKFIRVVITKPDESEFKESEIENITKNCSIIDSTIYESYEPYKSNILTVNEDIELGSVGNVQDELNLMTGELTQRTEEFILNNSSNVGGYVHGVIPSTHLGFKYSGNFGYDPLSLSSCISNYDLKLLTWSTSRLIYGFINKSLLDSEDLTGLQNFFANNDVMVRWNKSQESIKTVDLTITDQNGNSLNKIRPIEGTMHIKTDGTPIKPTFTGEIPVEAITQNLASFIEE